MFPVPQADSLGVPSLDNDPADADWTAEIATGSEDSTMDFGKRELWPHPAAKRLKVSKKLLRNSGMNVERIVMERLAYKFSVTEEKVFMTGTGSNQPLGLFTSSSDGISSARDVSTGNTTTAIQFDGLIEAKYSVKGGYWKNAKWLFHRDAMRNISKLKDGEGQYLWLPSVREDEPDRLLGQELLTSEFVPNTFTTGLFVGMYGDFKHYWIADALSVVIQRLTELYAEANQDGFIARMEVDMETAGQHRNDGLGHFVLDREDVVEVAVVALSPQMVARCSLDELGRDTHPIACLANAALDDIGDAEFLSDFADIDRLPLVGERRVTGDDEQRAEPAQLGDDVLGNAVGEVFLLRITTHVRKWQHRDRRLVG